MELEWNHLSEKMTERKFEITRKVYEKWASQLSFELNRRLSMMDEKEIVHIRAQFIDIIGGDLMNRNSKTSINLELEEWCEQTGEYAYNLGIPLNELLKGMIYYRRCLSEVIEEEADRLHMSIKDVFEVTRVVGSLLDDAVNLLSLIYIDMNKKMTEEAKSAFREVSVPIVPLSDDTAIFPLVGEIDTKRARLIMESTLEKATQLKLSYLIVDLSGVLVVDTMVAKELMKVIAALELLGVTTILTGIRTEIAQTVIRLEQDFSNLRIKGNLKQAITELI